MRLPQIEFQLGEYAEACEAAWRRFCGENILQRIWDRDFTVWCDEPDQISNRLGWLDSPQRYKQEITSLEVFAKQVCDDGITDVVLLGMGGSGLGAEVLAKVYGSADGYPKLSVLGTTDPQAISDVIESLDLKHSLFVVATKSGSTVETTALFKYCYNQVGNALGYGNAGQHFVAITDAGSPLEVVALQLSFRNVFLNDQNIGGRYSMLSYFGLVPAALLGIDLELLLGSAEAMAKLDKQAVESTQGGAYLGVVLGELAKQGRDKLTVVCDPKLAAIAPWLEQLVAESSGKQGKGLLPVLEDKLSLPERYGDDRLFVVIDHAGQQLFTAETELLAEAGFPVIRISLPNIQSLGSEFFRWQMATACLCHAIGVNPFDQPDVESAKQATRAIVETGTRPHNPDSQSIGEALNGLTREIGDTAYIAVLAYLNPNHENTQLLDQLCTSLRKSTSVPVTLGFGPSYLHSTGQLHKGGMGRGRFLLITADNTEDIAIPDEAREEVSSLTFGSLLNAQAWGDETALAEAGRYVHCVHFKCSAKDGLQMLLDALVVS